MHTSKIHERLAFTFQLIAVVFGLIFCSVDADMTEMMGKDPIVAYVILGSATAVFGLLGWIFNDTRKVGRIFLPVCVVVGAFLFAILKRMSKPFRDCYKIKQHCGSYRETFTRCKDAYDEASGYAEDYFYDDEDTSVEYE